MKLWQFPVSVIMALTFLAGSVLLWRFARNTGIGKVITGGWLCLGSIAAVSVMTAIDGTWPVNMHRSIPFLLAVIAMMVSLSFTVLDSLKASRGVPYLLVHTGLFLLLSGAFWGAPDKVDCRMTVDRVSACNMAYSADGGAVPLPFGITLEEFRTERYDDGVSPKQYSSTLDIDGKSFVTSVNHPCRYRGYFIYQYGFDSLHGEYSVLKLVKDPWLPLIYAGFLLLFVGTVGGMKRTWNSRYIIVAIILTAVIFTVISTARINFKVLMPALRSLWFVPHLALYMLAYSSLAVALITGIVGFFAGNAGKLSALSGKLLDTASSLLLTGMLCGAIWAKAAWGDWWTWDAKECWAAVTWLLTLAGRHLPTGIRRKGIALTLSILLAFAAMQVAWYGVDSLPASQTSMHTYR